MEKGKKVGNVNNFVHNHKRKKKVKIQNEGKKRILKKLYNNFIFDITIIINL